MEDTMRDPLTVPNDPRDTRMVSHQLAMADHLYAMARTAAIHQMFVALAQETLLTLTPSEN
jgi:hypothetical protein